MEHTIWDAVIHNYNTPKVEDLAHFVRADSEKGKNLIESILFFLLSPYKENGIRFSTSGDPNKLKEYEQAFSYLLQCAPNLSAMDIVKIVCPILLAFPLFTLDTDASSISGGMLVADKDIVENNPLANGVIYEILYPNLFSVLLLEIIGQKTIPDDFLTLAEFKRKYGTKEMSPLERDIKPTKLPVEFRNLFAVDRKSDNASSPYQIGTQFPELLYAILENINISPLSKKSKTSNSLSYSKAFYDKCIETISPKENWSEQDFAEFYLFERIFRLNTKFSLACFEYDLKDEPVLSPDLLRDFFFHSPLVIFPPKFLGLFYEKRAKHSTQRVAKQFLHFLIQLSAYWFPYILSIMREYMQENNIKSFRSICEFFFPEPNLFEEFQKNYTPNLEGLPSYERLFPKKECAARRARDTFLKRWSSFRPYPLYCAEAYVPLPLEAWRNMLYRCYKDLPDSEAAKSILLTLP